MQKFRSVVRVLGRVAIAGALVPAVAAAQLNITFYDKFPGTAPDPNLPFPGGSVLCTATAAGSATGIDLNFADASAVDAMCGSGAHNRINNVGTSGGFGARITGNFTVATGGTYNATINTDDGDVLTINGVTQNSDWTTKGGGPGAVTLNLIGGSNPFILDYFQGPCCGAFIQIDVGQGVTVTPPQPPITGAPEPQSLALVATGLVAVGGGVIRRRRA